MKQPDGVWLFGKTAVHSDCYYRNGVKVASVCAIIPTGAEIPAYFRVQIENDRQALFLEAPSLAEGKRVAEEALLKAQP